MPGRQCICRAWFFMTAASAFLFRCFQIVDQIFDKFTVGYVLHRIDVEIGFDFVKAENKGVLVNTQFLAGGVHIVIMSLQCVQSLDHPVGLLLVDLFGHGIVSAVEFMQWSDIFHISADIIVKIID